MAMPEMDWSSAGIGSVAVALLVLVFRFTIWPVLKLLMPKVAEDMRELRELMQETNEEVKAHRQEVQQQFAEIHGRVTRNGERIARLEGKDEAGGAS